MNILVTCAHPDDEVYTIGGTLALLAEEHDIHVLFLTDGCGSQYPDQPKMVEQKQREAGVAQKILGIETLFFGDFPDMKLDTIPHVELNKPIEKFIEALKPEVVLTHHHMDSNLDHVCVARSTFIATRPLCAPSVKLVAMFESPSPNSDFKPNEYVPIDEAARAKKIHAIRAYKSEHRDPPHYRNEDAMGVIMLKRGLECGEDRAEAFQVIRRKGLLCV